MKFGIILFLLIALAASGCDSEDECRPSPCKSVGSEYLANVNGFDLRPSAPYGNKAITTFKFKQTISTQTSPNSCTSCPLPSGSITLAITNNTASTLSFDYNITCLVGGVKWNYQGVSTISAMSTVDIGEVSKSAQVISHGTFSIIANDISYQ